MYVAHSSSDISSYTFICHHVMALDNKVTDFHGRLYYGLDNWRTGVKFPAERVIFLFSAVSRLVLGQPSLLTAGYTVFFFLDSKETGAWRWQPTPIWFQDSKIVWHYNITSPYIFMVHFLFKHRNIYIFTIVGTTCCSLPLNACIF